MALFWSVIDWGRSVANFLTDPRIFFALSIVMLIAMFRFRGWVKPRPAAILGIGVALFFVVSLFDPNFRKIVAKPDNVPIAGMLFLVGFFLWVGLKQAFDNDDRIAKGLPPSEADEADARILTWPDLVYSEFICLIILTVILCVWATVLQAPIEEPANPTKAPNPSKAPWYFLGLQEMLVYFDPWLAGVVFPSLIIVGLMALPYIDTNPKGNGYYTFRERKREVFLYMFGFVVLWVLLIIQGTFLRGPNWSFFGPYEEWDVHKLAPLNNVNLSEIIYVKLLGTGLPKNWFLREVWGIISVIGYFALPPLILMKGRWKRFYEMMGPPRFHTTVFLLTFMFMLPLKMALRWAFNLKYFIAIPEFFFNI
jgi:hypothetical protein